MLLEKLLRRKEWKDPETEEDALEKLQASPEELQEFKNRMFALMLQALYNSTTVLKAVQYQDDWAIRGDPITSAIVDGDLIINLLKKMGMYARFTMKENDDGSRSLKWIHKAIINGLREEFYDMENIRDGKLFMLDEKIASLDKRLKTQIRVSDERLEHLQTAQKAHDRAREILEDSQSSVRDAMATLREMSSCKDPEKLDKMAKSCVKALSRALSFTIPELPKENHEDTDGTDNGTETGTQEAETPTQGGYNR